MLKFVSFKVVFFVLFVGLILFACSKKDDSPNSVTPANASISLSSYSVVLSGGFPVLSPVVSITNTGGANLNSCIFIITVTNANSTVKDLTFSVSNLALESNKTVSKTLIGTENIPGNVTISNGVLTSYVAISSATIKPGSITIS